jgi:hypothetical protein
LFPDRPFFLLAQERSGSPGVALANQQPQYPNTTDGYEKSNKIGFNCWKSVIKGTETEVAIKLHNIDPSFDKDKMKVRCSLDMFQSSYMAMRAAKLFS